MVLTIAEEAALEELCLVMYSGGALNRATLPICKVVTIEFWVD